MIKQLDNKNVGLWNTQYLDLDSWIVYMSYSIPAHISNTTDILCKKDTCLDTEIYLRIKHEYLLNRYYKNLIWNQTIQMESNEYVKNPMKSTWI